MIELGSRMRSQPAPPRVVWASLVRPRDPAARQWLDLLDDEVDPQILDSLEPSLVVWSSLWPDRLDERIRFDIEQDGYESRLRWALLTPRPEPTASKIGHMRFRLNVLINAQLRRSYGQ
ncbi:hypothetical protein O7605_22145 [Verrucosispora sp. WMMA2121]|uniref:hypothetical protein n=1 Tax=Verrucosispora sp. WMMA2121 TaxID=3015164 RepID=UPI0022B619AD|nr:hypothetical protein [Verrucosispora sp. WMMA2121]MCZ7422199.1 hypothetical protein [Verrucosispora sp. WMMA2121]